MMGKDELIIIKKRLEELEVDWYIAEHWKDKRSRDRIKKEVSIAISNYADTLPLEVLGSFDTEVATAALNSQFAGDDIGSCINVLEDMIRQMDD